MPDQLPIESIITRKIACHAPLWDLHRHCLLLVRHLLSAAGFAAPLAVSGGWGVSVTSLPPFVRPGFYVALEGYYGGFVPPGQLFHSEGLCAPWQLESPSHSL